MGDKLMRNDTGQAIMTLLREFLNTQQSGLESKIGTLASLTTSAKESLVVAINELVANRGALSGLSTNAKNTLIAAINELVAKNTTQDATISRLSSSIITLETLRNSLINNTTFAHNLIWRGKVHGPFTQAHSDAIRRGDFSDIFIGDFFTSTITGKQYGWMVAAIDWFWTQNTLEASGVTHHILLLKSNSGITGKFNQENTTEGGYFNSDWRVNQRPTLEAQIAAADFIDESHLFRHSDYFVSAIDANGNATGAVRVNDSCLELPDEFQIMGKRSHHSTEQQAAGDNYCFNAMLPYFRARNLDVSSGYITRTIYNATQIIFAHGSGSGNWRRNANAEVTMLPYITVY